MRTWPLLVLVILMVWAVQGLDAEKDKEDSKDNKSSGGFKNLIRKVWNAIKKAGKDTKEYFSDSIKKNIPGFIDKLKKYLQEEKENDKQK